MAKSCELTVVTQVAVQDGRKHERLMEQSVDSLLVRLDANDAVLCERPST